MHAFDLPYSDTEPRQFSESEVDAFSRRIGWVDDVGVIRPETTIVEARALSWWPGTELILARDPGWTPTIAAWLLKDRIVRLDGQSRPIHQQNSKGECVLTRQTIVPYLGFFCTFVHGDEGPFLPISSLDDGLLPETVDRGRIAPYIRAPEILKEEDKGVHVECLVYYSDKLFLANFVITTNGTVTMIEDEALEQDLEAKIEMRLTFSVAEASQGDIPRS